MLPPELLHIIIQHLDLASLVSLSQVSRKWRDALCDDFFYRVAARDFNLEHRRFPLRQTWTSSAHIIYTRCVQLISHMTNSSNSCDLVLVPRLIDTLNDRDTTNNKVEELSEKMAQLSITKSSQLKTRLHTSHTTSNITFNCPLTSDFSVLFPTYSLQHLNNGFQQFDDGYCDKYGYIRLTDDPKHYQCYDKPTRDLYTCSNGLVIDLPQNYRVVPSTPTVKSRDAEGIWTERVDFERISRDVASDVVVATSSSTTAVWVCVTGELRVFWWVPRESRGQGTVHSCKISREWTRNKVQLFVYKSIVLVAVTQIHYIDWSIHSKQVWDVYQVTCDHLKGGDVQVTKIQSHDSSWGNILWYDGLRLCNTPQYACDRTHVIGDTIEPSQWGYGNCIRFNFDSDWIVGYDCDHKLRWIRNSVTGAVEHVPEHCMSFVGVSRGRLKVCVFDKGYLQERERIRSTVDV
ncbi:hypothetical protein B0I71DRAFT_149654 [Yarrowia lipolytica]|uniref:F-box domain-containing protein n=1 Tax=Yarrowia lipolytica TaxID=4952 RepID=A0A371BXJ6_YARLL|nr:hypothetical protein B0I71DRAFT_149654 [Yarrowia lipolytica]